VYLELVLALQFCRNVMEVQIRARLYVRCKSINQHTKYINQHTKYINAYMNTYTNKHMNKHVNNCDGGADSRASLCLLHAIN